MGIIKRVLIVGGDTTVGRMFHDAGFLTSANKGNEVPDNPKIDLICFTGGADIDPKLYGEVKLRGTITYEDRDIREVNFFERYRDIPKVGICRGGQLLNALSGGAMWQHVNNHTSSHKIIDLVTQAELPVTSTHHQMMIAGEDGEVLAIASKQLATLFQSAKERPKPKFDTEVVWYEKTQSLCFQPHPEYHPGECRKYFFSLIDKFLL